MIIIEELVISPQNVVKSSQSSKPSSISSNSILFGSRRSPVDACAEVQRHWPVLAVLGVALAAAVAPRLGAPGGPLHSRYTNYVTYAYIYAAAGYRVGDVPRRCCCCCNGGGGRALLAVLGHRFVLGPLTAALVLPAFTVFEADAVLLRGAWVSVCGGCCGWGVALARGRGIAVEALAAWSAALAAALNAVFAPLYLLIACGCTSARAVIASLWTAGGVLVAICAGAAIKKFVHHRPDSPSSKEQKRDREWELSTLATLVLLYEDCCSAFTDAQGQAHVRDALLCLSIVCTCVVCGAGAWWCLCRGAGVEPALATVALPHLVSTGWEELSCCRAAGSRAGSQVRLVRAAAAPAHALLLAALAVRTRRRHPHAPCSRCGSIA